MRPTELSRLITEMGLENEQQISFVHSNSLHGRHVPPFPADVPALIIGLDSGMGMLVDVLRSVYPVTHPVLIVSVGEGKVTESTLGQIGSEPVTALLVKPLDANTSFEAFHEVIAHLRAPDGCPWDREQTHLSLRRHLIEESYEALDALDAEDPAKMSEEFGDLLLQIVLHAQIAKENGTFSMTNVIKGIADKIIRRHPHVFGDLEVGGVGQVLQNWEKLKSEERKANGTPEKGILDGLPSALPALTQAMEYQDRAARVGFDWPEVEGVLDKIKEEIEEVRLASNEEELAMELGDLMFALVNLARWKKVDAEAALREANARFRRRFAHIETTARLKQVVMRELSLDEMESLWQEAKRMGL